MDNKDITMSGLRTVLNTRELLLAEVSGDEAWIKLRGFQLPRKSAGIPDDVPISKTAYLGPFYIYDVD